MLQHVQDVLARQPVIQGTEVEIRIPVPYDRFHGLRSLFGEGRTVVHSKSTVTYNDKTDIRCVDGIWQRKRVAVHQHLRCYIPCSICVCIESTCSKPDRTTGFITVTRTRWSYTIGQWAVDWTHSKRSSNVELEFLGSQSDLQASENLCNLGEPLSIVLAHLACLAYGRPRRSKPVPFSRLLPFAPFSGSVSPVPAKTADLYCRYMAQEQPISLMDRSAGLHNMLVSLKYDGLRVVICAQNRGNLSVAWAIERRKGLWSIPCTDVPCELVIDCELILHARRVIVFDIWSCAGKQCTGMKYTERLQLLSTVLLPTLLGYTIEKKVFFPPGVVSSSWYTQHNSTGDIDGIIFHDRESILGHPGNLLKWKPKHTVDLEVRSPELLVDRHKYKLLPCTRDHGQKLRKGDIWECEFIDNHVHPTRLRTDKCQANAHHVCQEIYKAHLAGITIQDLEHMVRDNSKKRKHDGI